MGVSHDPPITRGLRHPTISAPPPESRQHGVLLQMYADVRSLLVDTSQAVQVLAT